MPDIKYVGLKPLKSDNVAGTGLTWTPGQVHKVASLDACQKLLKHSDVWALVEPSGPVFRVDLEDTDNFTLNAGAAEPPADVDPETMTREQLMAALTARGIEFHPNTGDKKLRAKLTQGA
jgi:hypothetical protein